LCRHFVFVLRGEVGLLAGRRFAYAESRRSRLLAGLDVAGRLDDLVERVPPVDHRPVLARVDELFDEDAVFLAITGTASGGTVAASACANAPVLRSTDTTISIFIPSSDARIFAT